ncbi:MAG: flagellar hook assembly protein FlgD [Pseudomonadales bacterium]
MDVAGIRSFRELNGAASAAGGQEELGKSQFMELMIAQMNNQDPLDPAKNEDFIAQLAQFSTLEGIQNLNTSFSSMATSLQGSMAMQAASLVGRSVLAPTNQGISQGNGLAGSIDVPNSAGSVIVEISDTSGALVRRVDLGPRPQGAMRFAWDGRTDLGEPTAPGLYRVNAFSDAGGERSALAVNMPDQVVSVSIGEGGFTANLASGASVSASQIKEIQ